MTPDNALDIPDTPLATSPAAEADGISVRGWFVVYGVFWAVCAGAIALLLARQPWPVGDWWSRYRELLPQASPTLKLLVFLVYLSMCCTFFPLPTGWIVAAVATREAAVATSVSDNVAVVAVVTALLVGAVGGLASTIANLTDYHLFTLLLRHRRLAKVRDTRVYAASARWFARSPLFILVTFNIIPVPVDVVRMLAATYRYPRGPFAAANFLGRFVRYAVIAFVTYWWDLGWVAVAALLGLAVVLAGGRLGRSLWRRLAGAGRAEA